MGVENSTVEQARARAAVYYYLAALFSYPDGAAWRTVQQLSGEDWLCLFALLGWSDGRRGQLQHRLLRIDQRRFLAEHLGMFGHTAAGEIRPYEAGYGTQHVFQETQCLADVAGFYRAFGLEASDARRERPDHIAVELEFMHVLALKEAYAIANGWSEKAQICREAQRAFLRDHLGRWAPSCLKIVSERSHGGTFALIAEAASACIRAHCCDENIEPGADDLTPSAPTEAEGSNFPCMAEAAGGPQAIPGESLSVREERE